MNNIKSLIAALAFAGLTACADNSPKTFSGFITDASMNTVTVRALTDESTCTFATTDADKSDANGLLLGAPVTVDYTGKLKDGAAATKIADRSHLRRSRRQMDDARPDCSRRRHGRRDHGRRRRQVDQHGDCWSTPRGNFRARRTKSCSRARASATARPSTSPRRRDRQNGRRKLHPHNRGHGHGLHQGQAVNSFPPRKASASGLPGALSFPGRVRRPFFPENSGSDAC